MRSGGQIVIDALRRNGMKRLFTVPGESVLSILDALHDIHGCDVVVCRNESGAAFMAEATARLDAASAPAAGVALVSRGPGLANAIPGLHAAVQNATPLVLLVGLGPTAHEMRGGFQEISLEPLAATFAKHVETVRDTARLPEVMARALVLANAGRQGPVVIGLPEDVLAGVSDIADVAPVVCADPGPTYDDLQHLAGAIDAAQWPLLLVGGRVSPQASRQLQAFAERLDLPLVASFRCQDAVDNRSPIYCGHAGLGLPAKLKAALASSDLIVALGTSIDEITSGGYATIAAPSPRQRLVHVHPDPAVIGRNHHALLPIVSSIDRFAERLDDLAPSMRPGMVQRWSTLRRDMRQAYETSRTPSPSSAPLQLDWVVRHLSETLPADAILTNGAGNYAAALHRGFTYKVPGTQLAPVSGSMGYGLPAAIAAKLARPGVDVVAFAGDGCLQMTVQELATAVQYNAAILVVVANNAMLGTVRTAQERRYPGRVIGSSLVNPDFAALAHAHGAFGVSVTTNEAFTEAVKQTRLQHGPAVIELALGPDQLRGGAQA